MRISNLLAVTTAILTATTNANTEKLIFLAPAVRALPDSKPGTDFLQIKAISHQERSLRTSLQVKFPSGSHDAGTDHWFLLRSLHANQRYELRICWAAIQPTAFTLAVHTLSDVFDSPHLIQDLAKTVARPEPKSPHAGKSEGDSRQVGVYESLLFLRIQAAADFFSPNKTLMVHPPDVDVDIILDPYIASIFPESLQRPALYLLILALLGFVASSIVWQSVKAATEKSHVD